MNRYTPIILALLSLLPLSSMGQPTGRSDKPAAAIDAAPTVAGCVDDCIQRRQMQAMSIQAIRAFCEEGCVAASLAKDKLLLTNAEGKVIGVLKPDRGGFKVHDAGDRLTARIRLETDLVRVRDSEGAESWRIKRKDDGAEIISSEGQRLFRLKTEGGRWKLENSSGNELAECRPKDGGYELSRAGSRAFARVKRQNGRLVFETMAGWPPGPLGLPGSLEGSDDARAGMWFAFENFSLPEQASLFVYFLKVQR